MKSKQLSNLHKAVIKALKNGPLTSFQILNEIKNFSLILEVYNIIDELKNMGILESYTEQEMKYHYIID